MAITNPQAVVFCNEKVRPTADKYMQLYWLAKFFTQEWAATGMAALIPNTADIVVDGSETDGRTPITGQMVNGLKNNLDLLITDLEANSKAKLNGLSQIAVNENP